MPEKMKTFTCRTHVCKGMTPRACIKRQWAKSLRYASHPECASGCVQGLWIARSHPELVPDTARPGCVKSSICPVCGDKFPPMTSGQIHCSRECSGTSRFNASTPSSSLPIAGAHGGLPPYKELEVAPVGPGELAEVPA